MAPAEAVNETPDGAASRERGRQHRSDRQLRCLGQIGAVEHAQEQRSRQHNHHPRQQDCRCEVIAPSLIPRKPGERIKTDRRDALKLLQLFKAGLLTAVHAPDEQDEADRELTRLRETAKENLKRSRHQILKFLTRHGYVYSDGSHWTQRHVAWLRSVKFTEPELNKVFESYFWFNNIKYNFK